MRFVSKDQHPEVRVIDKRAGADAPEVSETRGSAPPSGEGSVAAGEPREGPAAAPPPAEVLAAVKQVDFLKVDDQFIVRDVTYRVVSVLAAQNALLVQPVDIGRATRKAMRKAGRA